MPSMKSLIDTLKCLPNPDERFKFLSVHGFYKNIPDEEYLKKKFKIMVGYELNLEDPTTFSEKLQWYKLYYHNPILTKLVDKYEVKQFVAEKLGKEHVIPALGVWEQFEDIDFDKLPNQFVLKCTHDSGGQVIVKDKQQFDIRTARKRINNCMKRNYFYSGREWAYKNVPHRIIAEPYIDSLGGENSVEYKLTCFDGVVKLVTVCKGIAHTSLDKRTNDHYDRDLNRLPFYVYYKNPTEPSVIPEQIHDMIEYAETLSAGLPQVRVDFYLPESVKLSFKI